jgi:hypothetical protein
MGSPSRPPAPVAAPPPPPKDTTALRKRIAARSFRGGFGAQQVGLGGVTDDPLNQRKTLLGK